MKQQAWRIERNFGGRGWEHWLTTLDEPNYHFYLPEITGYRTGSSGYIEPFLIRFRIKEIEVETETRPVSKWLPFWKETFIKELVE